MTSAMCALLDLLLPCHSQFADMDCYIDGNSVHCPAVSSAKISLKIIVFPRALP